MGNGTCSLVDKPVQDFGTFRRQWTDRAHPKHSVAPPNKKTLPALFAPVFYERVRTGNVRGLPYCAEEFCSELRGLLFDLLFGAS